MCCRLSAVKNVFTSKGSAHRKVLSYFQITWGESSGAQTQSGDVKSAPGNPRKVRIQHGLSLRPCDCFFWVNPSGLILSVGLVGEQERAPLHPQFSFGLTETFVYSCVSGAQHRGLLRLSRRWRALTGQSMRRRWSLLALLVERAAVLKENRGGRLILLPAPPPPPASNGNWFPLLPLFFSMTVAKWRQEMELKCQ